MATANGSCCFFRCVLCRHQSSKMAHFKAEEPRWLQTEDQKYTMAQSEPENLCLCLSPRHRAENGSWWSCRFDTLQGTLSYFTYFVDLSISVREDFGTLSNAGWTETFWVIIGLVFYEFACQICKLPMLGLKAGIHRVVLFEITLVYYSGVYHGLELQPAFIKAWLNGS